MDYPVIFPILQTFAGRSADDVRAITREAGFTMNDVPRSSILRNPRMRGFSEIWFRLAGRGYAIVRVDTQGHSALTDRDGNEYAIGGIGPGPHGSVPHFHKEWITAELFQTYLVAYVPQVVRYDDAGNPVTGALNDGKAKATHIKA